MSSSSVRQIITKSVEEEVLLEFLGDDYLNATQEEKDRIIHGARGRSLIESSVENIIQTFLQDIQKGSPDVKRARTYNIFAAAMTLLFSSGLGHAVNLENFAYGTVCFLGLIGIQTYTILKGF
ncbi:hypothetical protein AN962_03720 [Bacillus sp. FJAT-21955]|nr:hypothetical protein AN962_03720 [Bacillus sp. FJAT-21955]